MRSAIAIARPAKASYAARSAPRSPRAIRAMISSSPSPAAAATRIQSKCTAVKHPAGSAIVQALPAITHRSYGTEERTDSSCECIASGGESIDPDGDARLFEVPIALPLADLETDLAFVP